MSNFTLLYEEIQSETNMDDLHKFKYFEFERESRVGAKIEIDRMGCYINRLRSSHEDSQIWEPFTKNLMRVVKTENCDYKIPEQEMMAWVSYYRIPQSPVIKSASANSLKVYKFI